MKATFVPQIVSANALLHGETIYLTESGMWSRHHRDAAIARDGQRAAELLAIAEAQPGVAVGPYLVDVEISADGVPQPSHLREAMRVHGPSVGHGVARRAGGALAAPERTAQCALA